MMSHDDRLKTLIREVLESRLEDAIEELIDTPEFSSVEAFVEYKLEEDQYSFDFIELQALARTLFRKNPNVHRSAEAPQRFVNQIKEKLINDFGFKFIPREHEKQQRGFRSPSHGTSPFKGNAGGSGMGNTGGFGGESMGFGMGGGPGAIGGGYEWSSTSSRDLPMGAGQRKK